MPKSSAECFSAVFREKNKESNCEEDIGPKENIPFRYNLQAKTIPINTHREANASYSIVQLSLSLSMNRVGRILKSAGSNLDFSNKTFQLQLNIDLRFACLLFLYMNTGDAF